MSYTYKIHMYIIQLFSVYKYCNINQKKKKMFTCIFFAPKSFSLMINTEHLWLYFCFANCIIQIRGEFGFHRHVTVLGIIDHERPDSFGDVSTNPPKYIKSLEIIHEGIKAKGKC